jgi:hypothetical protein
MLEIRTHGWLRQSVDYQPLVAEAEASEAHIDKFANALREGRLLPAGLELIATTPILAERVKYFRHGFDMRCVQKWSEKLSSLRAAWEVRLSAFRDHMPLHPRFAGVSKNFAVEVEEKMQELEVTVICDWASPEVTNVQALADRLRKSEGSLFYSQLWERRCDVEKELPVPGSGEALNQ